MISREVDPMNEAEFQKTVIDQLVRLTQEVTEIKQEVTGIKKAQVRIENEQGDKIKALFDAQEVMMEKMERFNESQARIEDKLDRLALKVSTHDMILKRVK